MYKKVVQIINRGGVAVIATDTIYGLLAQALNPLAVERVYRLRRRRPEKPFIILISDVSDLNKFKIVPTNYQRDYFKKYWPGEVSFILECSGGNYEFLTRDTGSLAFRIPKKPALLELIKQTGPLIAPSANPEGRKPAESIKMAKDYFGQEVDIYIDEGDLHSEPSTLVRLKKDPFDLLRPGVIKIK